MPKGERHDPFTSAEAAEMGARGAAKTARVKRTNKSLSVLAAELLRQPCTSHTVLDALEEAGFKPERSRTTRKLSHAVAITANIIRLAESPDPKVASAAVKAYIALLEVERAEADRKQSGAKASGGVVVLPQADALDEAPEGEAEAGHES